MTSTSLRTKTRLEALYKRLDVMQADFSKEYDAGALDGFSAESDSHFTSSFRPNKDRSRAKDQAFGSSCPVQPSIPY